MMWFVAGGVIRYDGRRLTAFTVEDGLYADRVLSVAQDKEGNLWFGTRNPGGANRYDGKTFTFFNKHNGLPSPATRAVIKEEIEKLTGMDKQYNPFVSEVEEMVGGFQLDELCDFLKTYLEIET